MQFFKENSAEELKWYEAGAAAFDFVNIGRDTFFDEAFECFALGDILWESDITPLSNAITQEIYRQSFVEIFEAFIAGGTFEAYITVFQKIFGEQADVTFTVPAPGKLQIAIDADEVELSNFISRTIVSNEYVIDAVVQQSPADNILFQTIKGFASEYELEQMLFEMVPAGVYTEISLTLGT